MSGFIDVSNVRPNVNLATAKTLGWGGVYCKASQGTYFDDTTYPGYRQAAKASGLPFGGYDFGDVAKDDPVAEAERFLNDATPQPGDMVPVLDVENGLAAGAQAWIKAWLDHVEAAIGCPPGIYTGAWWWNPNVGAGMDFSRYPLWLAAYQTGQPAVPVDFAAYVAWQYTDRTPVGPMTVDASHGMMPLIPSRTPPPAPTHPQTTFFNGGKHQGHPLPWDGHAVKSWCPVGHCIDLTKPSNARSQLAHSFGVGAGDTLAIVSHVRGLMHGMGFALANDPAHPAQTLVQGTNVIGWEVAACCP